MLFDYRKVADPKFFAENRLPAHSDHAFYRSEEEAKTGKSSFVHSLNGLWKFSYAKNYDSAIPDFEANHYNCRSWDDIHVPAHIQMEGYDAPHYANVQYPWDGHEQIDPGQIPSEFNPVGSYCKYFRVPAHFAGANNLYISFQGVESAFALWLNGKYVGYSADSFTPSDFNLTPFLRDGENKLCVQVFKWTSGSWIEDQDFFRFSGIFRDVFLYTVPKVHIRDMFIEAGLDNAYVNGILRVTLQTTSKSGKAQVSLMDGEEEILVMEGGLKEETVLKADLFGPRQWSAEDPQLYDIIVRVFDAKGNLTEVITEKVGFRRFELIENIMCLNGKRIEFKGVNRHDFASRLGRAMTKEEAEIDLLTMKRYNINAVRTSHYPNPTFFYRMCDIYGLYVIDETNLESHGAWDPIHLDNADISTAVPGDKPEWKDVVLDRANSMFQRDKNHPCILIWSCGNESFGGKNIFAMAEQFRKLDSSRLVHYEGVVHDRRYNNSSDMESQMYTPAAKVEAFLQKDPSKPFIMCEYAHTMGNSGGAIHYYTDLAEREPLFQGGFIWDYIDQSILKKNRYGEEFMAYGGDFGDRPTDYEFSGNGIVYGDHSPSPKMQTVKYVYQNIKAEISRKGVQVVNRNLFTSTAAFDCVIILKKEGTPLREALLETDVAPLSEKEYKLPFALPKENGEYTITASFRLKEATLWAEKGHEIAFGQSVLSVGKKKKAKVELPLRLIRGRHNYGIKGENFEVLFSRLKGGLVSYRWAGREMIESIPMPNFWRAPTDNDNGNRMPARYGQWLLASRYATHKPIFHSENVTHSLQNIPEVVQEDETVHVTYQYYLPTKPVSECSVRYTITGDGAVTVALHYVSVTDLDDMPEFGMLMKLSADFDHLEWYGLGPEETYVDRMLGAKLDVYKGLVKDQMAKYLIPQETGNKVGVRWAKVTDARGRGMLFTADDMEFSALPYTPFEIENARHAFELPPVHYTVIRASLKRMGIAGDDSWGALTHPEFLLPANKPLAFSFTFKGI